MMSQKKTVVRLDALAAEVAGVVELFGREHDVHQLDGEGYHVAVQIQTGEIDILEQYKLAARMVPSLAPEEVAKLTARQVGVIITIADGRIREVAELLRADEGADPNGSGPADASPPA